MYCFMSQQLKEHLNYIIMSKEVKCTHQNTEIKESLGSKLTLTTRFPAVTEGNPFY